MKKLNFPVLKGDPMPTPVLSMDEFVDFVEFNLNGVVPQSVIKERRYKLVADVPFKLK